MRKSPLLLALPFVVLSASIALAQDHGHDEHVATLGDLVVLHAWATPAQAGDDALVFFEVQNSGGAVTLSGGEAEIAASVDVVGASMIADGTMGYQPIGPFTIPAGSFSFDPAGLGLRLNDLSAPIAEGEVFEMHLLVEDGELEISVEVQAAGAKAHSHAGHSH
jgi:periplasmic copper chaperone A